MERLGASAGPFWAGRGGEGTGQPWKRAVFLQNINLDPHQNIQEDREKEEVMRGRLGKKRASIFAQAAQGS